mmetsp:Transcript_38021/g.70146  ORF Transcript_38021/g.70146 Transcript_38021/m.70146 type:complete len:161 (-) Transcript_38021:61-543(-)
MDCVEVALASMALVATAMAFNLLTVLLFLIMACCLSLASDGEAEYTRKSRNVRGVVGVVCVYLSILNVRNLTVWSYYCSGELCNYAKVARPATLASALLWIIYSSYIFVSPSAIAISSTAYHAAETETTAFSTTETPHSQDLAYDSATDITEGITTDSKA